MTAPAQPRANEAERLRIRGAIELQRCTLSPLYWAERYAWTRDDKDRANPFKKLIGGATAVRPSNLTVRDLNDDEDDYLRYITCLWHHAIGRLIVLEKSRQVRISWWAMSMQVWLCQFHVAQRAAVQSKQLEDADKMCTRAEVILSLQRKVAPWVPWPAYRKKYALLTIKHGDVMGISRIEGLAQGGGKIRGEAYGSVFSDETAFQPEAEEGYAAAMPIVEGTGRYLAVSSAWGGTFFHRLATDAA